MTSAESCDLIQFAAHMARLLYNDATLDDCTEEQKRAWLSAAKALMTIYDIRTRDDAQPAMDREQVAKVFAYIWHGDLGEWQGFLSKADAFLAYPFASQPSPAATVETKSAPPHSASQLAERAPSSDAAPGGADTQCSAATGDAEYRQAIDEALVTRHLGVAKGNARDELNIILSWEVDVALDPRVSAAAQALIDQGRAQPQVAPDRDKLWSTIAKEIACEKDCQKWPSGCGCAMAAADAILALTRPTLGRDGGAK